MNDRGECDAEADHVVIRSRFMNPYLTDSIHIHHILH